jgi:hypothetical protein
MIRPASLQLVSGAFIYLFRDRVLLRSLGWPQTLDPLASGTRRHIWLEHLLLKATAISWRLKYHIREGSIHLKSIFKN